MIIVSGSAALLARFTWSAMLQRDWTPFPPEAMTTRALNEGLRSAALALPLQSLNAIVFR
jgi:hypothetical protein